MRLADFIASNPEPILAEWVAFAATRASAQHMNLVALRDHATAMLAEIVRDLRTGQTDIEQSEKAKGHAGPRADAADTAAEVHGAGRADSGFSVGEMVSEYRALRASVLRLWTQDMETLTGTEMQDLMRFNEAIDQSLAESVERYTEDVDRAKDLFDAILGYDLRAPLAAMTKASAYMLDTGELKEPYLALTASIARNSRRTERMLADLLDFTRSRLGSGVAITRSDTDLTVVARQAAAEVTAAHPESALRVTATGDAHGNWDAERLGQVVSNLLENAVQHGISRSSIGVTIEGEPTDVVLRVHNYGPAIPAGEVGRLFDPFKRLRTDDPVGHDLHSLGLGLYITERIVTAHGGTIDVRSSLEGGTLFSIRLPRHGPIGSDVGG